MSCVSAEWFSPLPFDPPWRQGEIIYSNYPRPANAVLKYLPPRWPPQEPVTENLKCEQKAFIPFPQLSPAPQPCQENLTLAQPCSSNYDCIGSSRICAYGSCQNANVSGQAT